MTPRVWLTTFFGSRPAQLFVTANFGYRVSMSAGERTLVRFFNGIQRRINGRGWAKRTGPKRLNAVGVWEHVASNPHCHLIVSAPPGLIRYLQSEGRRAWVDFAPFGQLDVREIHDHAGLASYMSKEARDWDDLDRLFIYGSRD